MFHANDILLQSRSFDKNSTQNKFSELIYNILAQFKAEHLDRLINSTGKYVSDEKVNTDLIDGIIKGRCSSLKMLPELSIREQFYILAHMNLDLVTPEMEKPSPVFSNLIYSIIRQAMTQ